MRASGGLASVALSKLLSYRDLQSVIGRKSHETAIALTLLSIGDFFVEVKKLSEKATETLYQTLSLSAKAIENFGQRRHDVV